MIRQHRSSPALRNLSTAARRRRRALGQRVLELERLENRELLATLTSGSGEGHLTVQVNEFGAFGDSATLAVASPLNPNSTDEITDATYDPIGILTAAGTTFESAIAVKVNSDPVTFLTAGTIAASGNFTNGLFQVPVNPNQRILNSTFYYPSTAGPQGQNATLRFDLRQELIIKTVSGSTPVSVTLRQTYTITNLTAGNANVEVYRYFDGDLMFDGSFVNDGAGMRQVIQGEPERVWMTNTATNTNKNDRSYIEVRSNVFPDSSGVPTNPGTNRWEVGLAPPATVLNPTSLVANILAGGPLRNDIIRNPQSDIDGNNKVDNGSGADWSVALRNVYSINGNGAQQIYVTDTQWGDPEIGDPDPPVVPSPTLGNVAGTVFIDRNNDGVRGSGDGGLQGWRVYADLNNNGTLDGGEPSTVSNSSGFYTLPLALGSYTIREVPQANWTITVPAGGTYGVTLNTAGQVVADQDFGNFPTPASISGQVFEDINRNGRLELGEPGLGTVVVYVDYNNNGALDATEPNATSAAGTGVYVINNIQPGQFAIRQVVPGGYFQTLPSNNGAQFVSLPPAGAVGGVNFGDSLLDGSVGGKVYLDVNHNGAIDPGEPGLGGVIVWIDRDNDGIIGLGENGIKTGADGTFGLLGIRPGTYSVRMALPAGYENIIPGTSGAFTVTVSPGVGTGNIFFLADQVASVGPDFGDAPFPYPTTLAQNGARAVVVNNFGLGSFRDGEGDGLASDNADGDDNSSLDDEDGVEFLTPLVPGQPATIRVTVSTGGKYPGLLQGFIDFNRNGSWNDISDRIVLDRQLPGGAYEITFTVPATAVPGKTFARFRYGYEHGIGPTGNSIAGEVEDYAVTIVGPTPTANNDTYNLTTTGAAITLNVLANDLPSSNGDITIKSINTTGLNGSVTIAADGKSLLYTPTGQVSTESFTYTIEDPAHVTATATVTINLTIAPIAVDDLLLNVAQNVSTTFSLANQIFNNDFAGTGTLSLDSPPTAIVSQGGTLVANAAGTGLVYTPVNGFAGTEQFSYTVRNSAGLTSTARITIQVTPGNANNLVALDVEVLGTDGLPLGPGAIGLGQEFFVRVSTTDLRAAPVLDPNNGTDVRGVYAAYLDLLFDRARVQPVADSQNPFGIEITFGSAYGQALQGSTATPGMLDEVGSTYVGTTIPVVGNTPLELFTVRFVVLANASNGVATFFTDPSDKVGNEVLLIQPPLPGVDVIGINEIQLDSASVTIDSSVPVNNPAGPPNPEPGSGTGGTIVVEQKVVNSPARGNSRHQNSGNVSDVNRDNLVSPMDVLLVINMLNTRGPRSLTSDPDPMTQAEPLFYDVNGDNLLSPLDALMIINQLNSRPLGEDTSSVETASVSVSIPGNSSVTLPTTETKVAGGSTTVTDNSADDLVDSLTSDSIPVSSPRDYAFVDSLDTDYGSSLGSSSSEDEDLESILEDLA